MAYLNIKIPADAVKFNWDDIEVGNHQLNHSEKFFTEKHIKHERLDELEEMELINEQMATTDLNETITTASVVENKENIHIAPANVKIEIDVEGQMQKPQLEPLANSTSANVAAASKQIGQTTNFDVTVKATKPPTNLASQWSTQKRVVSRVPAASTGAVAKQTPAPPNAYLIKDVYKRNKEEALRKRLEEERKMREFHSKPIPNYSAQREQMERRKVKHNVTVPITPLVLKKSRETEEKRKKKLEDFKRQQRPPKFGPRSPSVLKDAPFVPKKLSTVLESRPFNLCTEKRLEERKQYDAAAQRARAEKEKQVEIEEEERRKRIEEHVRELRKNTTFKARPNPFK